MICDVFDEAVRAFVRLHCQNERKNKNHNKVFKPMSVNENSYSALSLKYIRKLFPVVGNGLVLTLFLSSFAVYSDCWEKGITQTKLCQKRGIDGHFIPIPVVIGLWYGIKWSIIILEWCPYRHISVNVHIWIKMNFKDLNVMISAILLIFEVWQAVMGGYQLILQICSSVSYHFLNISSKYKESNWNRTLVNLRKDGSLFHIAVVLDGLGLIRKLKSPMLLQKFCWWQVDIFRLQHPSSTSM